MGSPTKRDVVWSVLVRVALYVGFEEGSVYDGWCSRMFLLMAGSFRVDLIECFPCFLTDSSRRTSDWNIGSKWMVR